MHSHVSNLVHVVFSTKERRSLLKPEWQDRVWAFMGGIARENGMKALKVGGFEDHAHLLLSVPAMIPIAKAVQLIKAGSSKMIRQTFTPAFEWQEGYGAFSIGVSQMNDTIRYIANQAEHHRRSGFDEEFAVILQRHGIEKDQTQSS
jgi:REP element-mobilizing transposase RayT